MVRSKSVRTTDALQAAVMIRIVVRSKSVTTTSALQAVVRIRIVALEKRATTTSVSNAQRIKTVAGVINVSKACA